MTFEEAGTGYVTALNITHMEEGAACMLFHTAKHLEVLTVYSSCEDPCCSFFLLIQEL